MQCMYSWAIILFGVLVGTSAALAAEVDSQQILQAELAMSPADATAYWDGISYTIASMVAQGRRVALNGLGAFSPSYRRDESGEIVRSMRFEFDLGPATEAPGVVSVFDAEVLASLSSFGWLKAAGGSVERRLTGDEWNKLLDIFVFSILRNVDGQARQPLGLGFGHFYPTIDIDLSIQRDKEERRVIIDFLADDDSLEKSVYLYALSVDALEKMLLILTREVDNLQRYWRASGIVSYAEAGALVNAVRESWQDELNALETLAAQDHNATRSNKTASIIHSGLDGLTEAQGLLKIAAAQDHNATRSNKTARALGNVQDGGGWSSESLQLRAQDHNATRSNKTTPRAFYTGLVQNYGGAYSAPAQDHNATRSNKTGYVVAGFEPSTELEEYFKSAARF